MLTFVRKIRKSLIESGSSRKYMLYAIGEIALVVIGILIALQINNWNEGKKSNADEFKVLTDLRNALNSDLSRQFDQHMKRIRTDMGSLDFVFHHIENDLPYHDSLDSHFIVLARAGGRLWAPQITAYKLLESVGIDLISHDTVKNEILNIYNLDYPEIVASFENYKKNIYDYGRPIARTKFNTDNGMFTDSYQVYTRSDVMKLKPIDYSELSMDIEFLNIIRALKLAAIIDFNHLQQKKDHVQNVIWLIDSELKK